MRNPNAVADLLASATLGNDNNGDIKTSQAEFYKERDIVDMRISVFFDGTNNNKFNTAARLEYEELPYGPQPEVLPEKSSVYQQRLYNQKSGWKEKGWFNKSWEKIEDSYANDFSNVAIMFEYLDTKEDDATKLGKVYVEGIGTMDGEDDHWFRGGALGRGNTGILGKVEKGCKALAKEIRTLANGKKKVSLKIDVFGFSRGAAAARNFVHEITKKKQEASQETIPISLGRQKTMNIPEKPAHGKLGQLLKDNDILLEGEIEIVFAGLFDTVPSFKSVSSFIAGDEGAKELHLDAIRKANDVLHLTASDERRANFALADISSSKGSVYEKSLPGVHSDIGGGYISEVNEKGKTIYLGDFEGAEKEKKFLLEEGWFASEDEIKISKIVVPNFDDDMGSQLEENAKITIIEKTVSNLYSYIPLYLMIEKAESSAIKFKSDYKDKYRIPSGGVLMYAYDRLRSYVIENGEPMKFYTEEELGRETRNISNIPDGPSWTKGISNVIHSTYMHHNLEQKINDSNALKELRLNYFHMSHVSGNIAFFPYKSSIREKPSRKIIKS